MCTEEYSELVVLDATYKTRLTKNYKNRKPWKAYNPYQVLVTLPGTINEIFVKEGQKVEEGKVLLILEAMKMKNKIAAPISGKIKKINVEVGQSVAKNFLMIELEK
jgi:pyruvate carboxylase